MNYIARTLITAVLGLSIAGSASALGQRPDRLDRNALQVNAFLTLRLPGYPDVAPITASAYRASFIYWIEERGKALIRGEDIPQLVFSTTDAPGTLKALTIVIDGMPGTTAVLDWTSYPTVMLKPVELRVRAYDVVFSSIVPGVRPIVDVILSDIALSTTEVCAHGFCTAGYLDAENLEAQIVFSVKLPEHDYQPYREWLEGETALGELRIQLPNPFAAK